MGHPIHNALQELNDHLDMMMRWHGATHDQIEQTGEDFSRPLMETTKVANRIIKLIHGMKAGQCFSITPQQMRGLEYANNRIGTLRALGDRSALLKIRSKKKRYGLEKSVKPPFSEKEVALWHEITRLREKGWSWNRIRLYLIRKKGIKQMSLQGFQKLCDTLGVDRAAKEEMAFEELSSHLGLKLSIKHIPASWIPNKDSAG